VAGAAIALLGGIEDRRAAEALVSALQAGRYPASRIATQLDRFPLPIPDLLRPLLKDSRSVVRFWAATLLARYPAADGVDADLALLADDPDPGVRKAAVETLGVMGGLHAAPAALALLSDPVWYVKAHAARAIGELRRADLAANVAPLLADREWWVRQAAREALEAMGPEVWRDLLPYLDHPDAFARNNAAELYQNLGILDSLVVLEAATDLPSADKIDLLRKIVTAGGVCLTDALVERSGPSLAPRTRDLLLRLGLESSAPGPSTPPGCSCSSPSGSNLARL
jgi:hypothetical protein